MEEKFRLYTLNPKIRDIKNAKDSDLLHICAGTKIKFTSGPFKDILATILGIEKYENTTPSLNYHIIEVLLSKSHSIIKIPLHQYSIEYLEFASKIFSPEILIPNTEIFKVEYSKIKEINEQMIYEISKNPKYLDFLHPAAFEDLVSRIYGNFGFDVSRMGRWNQADGGVDIIAANTTTSLGDFKIVIQCKLSKNKIQPRVIRELNGILDKQNALKGIVVTSNYFTKSTQQEVQQDFYRIELKDRDFLLNSLEDFFK